MDGDVGDARDDPDPRAHEPAQIRDLARDVKAHLDHRDLVARLDPKEGERDADLVVERRRGAQDAVTRAERRGGGLLRRRLAYVAGDADGRDGVRVAQRFGETPQRVLGVSDLHDERARGHIGDGTLHDRGPGTVRERVRHEIVAVPLVAQGEEDAARFGDARVERTADEPLVPVRNTVDDPSTRRAKQLLEGEHVWSNGTERQGRSG